jgi:hypothetical protein
MKAIEEGKTATFYLKDSIFAEIIKRRYRTSEHAAAVNLQPLSSEEATRIKTDFNIDLDGSSSKETCPRCGSVYGTYEFIQQGIKEHGEVLARRCLCSPDSSQAKRFLSNPRFGFGHDGPSYRKGSPQLSLPIR